LISRTVGNSPVGIFELMEEKEGFLKKNQNEKYL
jgi:hypothetical protein